MNTSNAKTGTGCICYLVRGTAKDVQDLKASLASVGRHYTSKYPCDVFLFHESNLRPFIQEIVTAAPMALRFVELEFKLPEQFVSAPPDNVGYRHMCHFFANDIFLRPELAPYRYYMRLDTDSKLLGPVRVDLFQWMEKAGGKYAYICDTLSDQPFFATGLWERFREFTAQHPEFKTYKRLYTDIPELRVFYTNFEICDLAWFRRDPWQAFFGWIDSAQGIYRHRWGDHTIRYGGVNLFMEPAAILRAPIYYAHQGVFGEQFK